MPRQIHDNTYKKVTVHVTTHTGRTIQINKLTNKQTDRQAGRQAGRQTNKHVCMHVCMYACLSGRTGSAEWVLAERVLAEQGRTGRAEQVQPNRVGPAGC